MKQRNTRCTVAATLALAATGLFLTGQPASADVANLNPSNDTMVWHRVGYASYTGANFGSAVDLDLYSYGDGSDLNAFTYIQFDLSALPIDTLNAATLTLTKIEPNPDNGLTGSTRSDTMVDGRVAIYGMLNVAGNTAQNWDESTLTFDSTGDELDVDSVTGVTDPFNVGESRSVDFSTLDVVSGGNTIDTLSDASVTSFIQGRVDDDGYVTFLVDFSDMNGKGFSFNSSESSSGQPVLTLDYTPVPEPSVAFLGGLGLLALLVRRRHA